MGQRIEHIATVVRTGEGIVEVVLTAQSACATCSARMACGMSETAEKEVSVHADDAAEYAVGERVMVSVEREMGMKAVLWGYVMPFFVLLGVLAGATAAGSGDGVAALAALGGVVLYYGVLYLLRRRLERKFHFKIHKL